MYGTKRLDHLGLVAGVCEHVGFVGALNEAIGELGEGHDVSLGHVVKSMVLNGLGFVSRPLYLSPEFWENKPVSKLVGEGIEAGQLNESRLGRTLDQLYEAGVTRVFAHVAGKVASELGLKRDEVLHEDSTSFSVHGQYEYVNQDDGCIEINRGYSKDGRQDLKQVVVNLICEHEASLPLHLEVLSGNSSDKTTFTESIKSYRRQLEEGESDRLWVVDSALYSKTNINDIPDERWITRVPATLSEVQKSYQDSDPEAMVMSNAHEGYRYLVRTSHYGGIKQRWLVVYSEAAATRDEKTLRGRITSEMAFVKTQTKKLEARKFKTRKACQDAVEKLRKKLRFHTLDAEDKKIPRYAGRGRPKKDAKPSHYEWSARMEWSLDETSIKREQNKSGKFVLSTNELDHTAHPHDSILTLYKSQSATIERGFRFLKDPLFYANALFLKKPQRIMALLMVMGLSLLIYSAAEHILRTNMASQDATLPNQKGRQTHRITMRRVFQIFEGIDMLIISQPHLNAQQIINLKQVHHDVLALMPPPCKNIYLHQET